MTMPGRQNNSGFRRRLPVRWSAQSWRPQIIVLTPLAPGWAVVESRRFHHSQQVWIFRQWLGAAARQTAQPKRNVKSVFLNLPRLRTNNSSTTSL